MVSLKPNSTAELQKKIPPITRSMNTAAKDEMFDLLEKSDEIVKALNTREREAWDVKFQNFWTEIVN
jgi:hypothetical protein